MNSFLPSELIKSKRRGQEHSLEEIKFLVEQFTSGELPDYQMSAWLMAVFFKGMTPQETAFLTEQMLRSGTQLNFSDLASPAVDKHSTGGVGDKTSLILAPLVASAGVPVPMIAGRGLGHTGGTLDKLESIPGFNVHLSLEAFSAQVRELGGAIIGQTSEICPADGKIYALRDVTATVESLPLICASIMSKKLAEGLGGLVLDVKFGSGAFMKTLQDAKTLAQSLQQIGSHSGVNVRALLTSMDQPLGRFIGNSLEVEECLQIYRQEDTSKCSLKDVADTQELTLRLAAEMIFLGKKSSTPEEGYEMASHLLTSGRAFEIFEKMCRSQSGRLNELPQPKRQSVWVAPSDGYLSKINVERVGLAAIELGAGRIKTTDPIDPVAGLFLHKKVGDKVKKGEALVTMYSSTENRFERAQKSLEASYEFSLNEVTPLTLIADVLGEP